MEVSYLVEVKSVPEERVKALELFFVKFSIKPGSVILSLDVGIQQLI